MYSKLEIKKDAIIVETGDAEFHPSTANINGRCYFRDLPDHLKPKQLLYKTEDNWFVYDYDTYPIYKVDERLQLLQFAACDCLGNSSNAKYFKNKEKAEEFIAFNSPKFSSQEIIDLCEQIQFHNRIHDRADEDYYAIYVSLLKNRLIELSRLKTSSADR